MHASVGSSSSSSVSTAVKNKWLLKLYRQELKANWKPVPSTEWTVGYFGLVGVAFLALGIVYFMKTLEVAEIRVRYDNAGEFADKSSDERQALLRDANFNGKLINVTVDVTKDMDPPVYVYYELSEYYQNVKRYVRSLSSQQLGDGTASTTELVDCEPQRFTTTNAANKSEKGLITPCGLIAFSYFNDTIKVSNNGEEMNIDESGISWEWDRKYLYTSREAENFNDDGNRGGKTIEGPINEDESFMVWMRISAHPTVKKLYGKIDKRIKTGDKLEFQVRNQYNTYAFNGRKRLILSTSNWTGGRNIMTGVVYIVVGSVSLITAIVFTLTHWKYGRKPGDLSELSWEHGKVN